MENWKWFVALVGVLCFIAFGANGCGDDDSGNSDDDAGTSDTDADGDSDGDTDGDSDTDGDTDGDTDSDSDGDTDSDTDGDSDSNTGTCTSEDTRCDGIMLQTCDDNGVWESFDCVHYEGGICETVYGKAMCVRDDACGSLEDGDTDISGYMVVDGFFSALLDIRSRVDTLKSDFSADMDTMATTLSIDVSGADIQEKETHVELATQAEIDANVSGGLMVYYVPPHCTSSIAASEQALYDCEEQAGCTVSTNCLGATDVACEGSCHGMCSGNCFGDCVEESFDGSCAGPCHGTCKSTTALDCAGACQGDCVGQCHGTMTGSACDGGCDGTCLGTCQAFHDVNCAGTCVGECYVQGMGGVCADRCQGQCDGTCDGGCQGEITPVTCSAAACAATADCIPQAKCRARAEVSCTAPEIEFYYNFNPEIPAGARVVFDAKMTAFKDVMVSIIKDHFELQDIIDSAMVGFDTVNGDLFSQFQGGEFDDNIDASRLPCMYFSFLEADSIISSTVNDASIYIKVESDLMLILGIL